MKELGVTYKAARTGSGTACGQATQASCGRVGLAHSLGPFASVLPPSGYTQPKKKPHQR